jgi:hypothetical protein
MSSPFYRCHSSGSLHEVQKINSEIKRLRCCKRQYAVRLQPDRVLSPFGLSVFTHTSSRLVVPSRGVIFCRLEAYGMPRAVSGCAKVYRTMSEARSSIFVSSMPAGGRRLGFEIDTMLCHYVNTVEENYRLSVYSFTYTFIQPCSRRTIASAPACKDQTWQHPQPHKAIAVREVAQGLPH